MILQPRSTDRLRLDAGPVDAGFWPELATRVTRWLCERELAARDSLVLLPFAALLPAAREAFAGGGGWQPKIHTLQTWSAALAPEPPAAARQLSGHAVTDRASAALLLRGLSAGADWARRDPAGFDAAVAALVDSAQTLLRGARAQPPDTRAAWWSDAREALAGSGAPGPGVTERWLARIAPEWAAANDAPVSDRLWAERPAAWIGVSAGAGDTFTEALLLAAAARGEPVLWIDTAPPPDAPFDAAAQLVPPRRGVGDGLEGEAQAAALAVLEALGAGQRPVALIAQDRIVVRRIRALLERAGVAVHDETGWTLSTTRSAARLMAILRAAGPAPGRDALIDALKALHADGVAIARLEAAWRRGSTAEPASQGWLDAALAPLRSWSAAGPRSIAAWLSGLPNAAPGLVGSLADDEAGRAVLAALQLDDTPASPAWHAAMAATMLDFAAFVDWVDAALEAASFVPAAPLADEVDVVVTPLARAVLRPFGAVVMPGCDHQRLGAASPAPGLLPDALLKALGLDDAERRRQRERLAFAQILRVSNLTLLRRRTDQAEPLAPSVLVEHAWQARRRLGQPAPDEAEAPLRWRSVDAAPVARPAPRAASALPERLSASAVEQLRACPYRFFAQTLLGLREPAELDADLEKRDYGTWLHGVLHRFHAGRVGAAGAGIELDRERLAIAAADEQRALDLDAAQLLPFRAAFDAFCTHYLGWLHEREARGWRFEAGELALVRDDAALGGVALEGRIDRVDREAASGALELIDYKTGSLQSLRDKVAEPLEDTQLAFYAALLAGQPSAAPMRAIYLALDERKPPEAIEHPDVAASAEQLVAGLAQDLAKLRAGAAMPALGEGAVCEHCEVRGLCRRDHWSSVE